ncbi:hypothetical protein PMAYCL1PPCAC_08408, partial [Pristionchus mayeri]
FSTGSAIGLFSTVFPDNKFPIYLCCSCFTIPFTLMNINFLHRYWTVKSPVKIARFSCWRFCAFLSLYPLSVITAWMVFCLSVADDPIGRAVIEPAYLQVSGQKSMGRGWLLICIRGNDDQWNTETLVLTLIESTIHITNVLIASTLCSLTIYELRRVKTFSLPLDADQGPASTIRAEPCPGSIRSRALLLSHRASLPTQQPISRWPVRLLVPAGLVLPRVGRPRSPAADARLQTRAGGHFQELDPVFLCHCGILKKRENGEEYFCFPRSPLSAMRCAYV